MQEFGVTGEERGLKIGGGVGACGELGKANPEGEQEQRENHHQFPTSRHPCLSEGTGSSRHEILQALGFCREYDGGPCWIHPR